jgi:hypothetical protein
MRKSLLFISLIFLAACSLLGGKENKGKEWPPEGTPTQFFLKEDPEIHFVYNPDSPYIPVNKPSLRFEVTTHDSIPHVKWLSTSLHVETDQGYSKEIVLVPFACLIPIEDSPEEFPFNVEWWSCNTININNDKILSDEQIQGIEQEIDARLTYKYLFKTMPGGQYIFDLNQAGRPAIQQAITTLEKLSYISGDVDHANQFPRCWLSDAVPPPPCPPWYLFKILPISLDGNNENTIPAQEGGWVRVTYTQPDGTERSTTFTIPNFN